MSFKLVKVICQAHYIEMDDDGTVIDEHLGRPVSKYGREQVASFYDAAQAELAELERPENAEPEREAA